MDRFHQIGSLNSLGSDPGGLGNIARKHERYSSKTSMSTLPSLPGPMEHINGWDKSRDNSIDDPFSTREVDNEEDEEPADLGLGFHVFNLGGSDGNDNDDATDTEDHYTNIKMVDEMNSNNHRDKNANDGSHKHAKSMKEGTVTPRSHSPSPSPPYVEFNLSPSHEVPQSPTLMTTHKLPEKLTRSTDDDEDFFNLSTSDWKTMKTVSELDYYNERGDLEYTSEGFFDFKQGTGSRGYTKIDTEEQVAKYAELDKKTDFLFQRSRDEDEEDSEKQQRKSDKKFIDGGSDSDSEYEDDDNIDSKDTLNTTKSMLTDAQKFAYVGIARLISVEMATQLAELRMTTSNKVSKELSQSQKNFAQWTMVTTTKMYEHLDLTTEERRMIENLSIHGLEVADLTESLVGMKVNNGKSGDDVKQQVDLVWILICDLFLLLLSEGYYDSRSRSLLIKFAKYLEVPPLEVFQFERRLIDSLEMEDTTDKSITNKENLLNDRKFIDQHIKKNKKKRLAYIGLATLGGGLAIGLSAGLLAPVIGAGLAAGLTTVGIGGTSGFLAGVGGSAIITTGGVFAGVRVGSKAGARRLGDVQTFEIKPLHNNKRSSLILTVSGWMNGELDDVRLPFLTVDPVMGDMFSLLWEPEMLQSMGQTINILASEALTTSIQQILGATILTALMSAIQLPMALLKLSYLLDNPWNVSLDRAWKAGKILADTLLAGNLGVRPITLVGFSLGARLIYSCLIELAHRGGFGLIENVIILGTPIAVRTDQIALAKSVVSGRFVNGYSRKDWILGYLFRATGGGINTVAGLTALENVHGIENLDCTDLVEGHMSYRKAIPKILKRLEWEVLGEEFAEIEEPDPEQKERTRKLMNDFDEARAKMMKERELNDKEERKKKGWKSWFKPKRKEWWEQVEVQGMHEGGGEGSRSSESSSTPAGASTTNIDGNAEYMESTTTTVPIFDVGALLQEVDEIKDLGAKDESTLKEVRKEVDLSKPEGVKMNEDEE